MRTICFISLILVFCFIEVLQCYSMKPCNCYTDCGKNECCVSILQPRGKRGAKNFMGRCESLGAWGDDCLMSMKGKPLPEKGTVYKCPCRHNLSCTYKGVIETPLGKIGECRRPGGYRRK